MDAQRENSQSRSQAKCGLATTISEGGTQASADSKEEYDKFLIWLGRTTRRFALDHDLLPIRDAFIDGYLILARDTQLEPNKCSVQIFVLIPDEESQ